MISINTGGPAFPVTPTDRGGQCAPTEVGMTLRDYFAAESLAGLMVVGGSYEDLAISAYRMADAMLKAREES